MKFLIRFFKRKPTDETKNLTLAQVFSVSKTKSMPSWAQWKQLPNILNGSESTVIKFAFGVIVLSVLMLIIGYVVMNRVVIPAVGGEYTEALIGEPQLINPIYGRTSDVDADLASLIYSGLLKWDQDKGLILDLAESFEVSEDGKTYTIKIKDNARFHNGEEVRARDVLFTISVIQNTSYRSPLASSFANVSVLQVDDKTISFILEEPFYHFKDQLTVGILPASLWAEILPQNAPLATYNIQPIGSGPYKFAEFTKDKKGSIRSYTLERNEDYYDNPAFLERLTFKFYPDSQTAINALEEKHVEGVAYVPFESLDQVRNLRSVNLYEPTQPRNVVLLFNQKLSEPLKKKSVRQDIEKILDEVAPGFSLGEEKETITLTTVDSEELRLQAESIKNKLEPLNFNIEINLVPKELFFTNVLEPRNFEILLTAILLTPDPDYYFFWHSSQTKKPGLNLAGYKNDKVDSWLEKARTATDEETRNENINLFKEQLATDIPYVHLYESTYGYAVTDRIQNIDLQKIGVASDRFAGIENWYIKTKKALK